MKYSHVLIVGMMTLISTWYITQNVITPHTGARMQFEARILHGQHEPPYAYRLLKPLLHRGLEVLASPFVTSPVLRHVFVSVAVLFTVLVADYLLFLTYLKRFFPEPWPIVGLLLLQAIIPLSVTGFYMIDDFMTLLFYLIGMSVMIRGKDAFVPLIVGIGAFNREQSIFLVVLHFAHLLAIGRLRERFLYLILGCVAFAAVFVGLRVFVAATPSPYTVAYHIAENTDAHILLERVIPLWMAQVAVPLFLSVLAFRRSNVFFRASFVSLAPYTVLFFANGKLWEMAKYLPAFLVLIPMGLQTLAGRYVKYREVVDAQRPDA